MCLASKLVYASMPKGPVSLQRIAPTYAYVWEIQQVRWCTLKLGGLVPDAYL